VLGNSPIRILFAILTLLFLQSDVFGHERLTGQEHSLEDEIELMKAADEAWEFNTQELLKLSREGNTPESELLEYIEFVAELKHNVIEGCRSVRSLGGDGDQHDVECGMLDEGTDGFRDADFSDIQREATREEKANDLKGQLRDLESDLDDMLLKGQAKLERDDDIGGSGGGGGLIGEISQQIKKAEEQLEKTGGQSQPSGDATAGTGAGDAAGGSGAGAGPKSGTEIDAGVGQGGEQQGESQTSSPDDVGDGSDDDVVARQLREAAQAETDPELKEQLWDEYRKYKKSLR